MRKTELVRECADAMHVAEAGMEATLAAAKEALEKIKATKVGLGLTGTMGDACIARWSESIRLLEESMDVMAESHDAGYQVVKSVSMRGTTMTWPWNDTRGFAQPRELREESKVA